MQELIDADGCDISQIEPNIAAILYGKQWAVLSMPFNLSTLILYYNKDIFEKTIITEVPTSLEGFSLSVMIRKQGGAGEPALALSIYG